MPNNKKFLITTIAIISSVMEILDMTIVNVALPDMQGALATTPDQISWVLTSYMVTTAIFVPLTGFLSEKFGQKQYFLFCLMGFTVASTLCGLATSLEIMVLARLAQGIFGAGLLPLSQTIIYQVHSKEELGKALAIWTMGIIIGPVVGPTIGGYIIDQSNWRWIFFINIPVGIIASVIAWRVLEESPKKDIYVDWLGIILLAFGIGSLQLTLDRGNTEDWFESNMIWWSSIIAIIGIFGFIYYTIYKSPKPIINLQIFQDRNFVVACFLMLLTGLGLFGSLVLQPIMMNFLFNYPALEIGITMMPRALASFVTMLVIAQTINKISPRTLVVVGMILILTSAYFAASTLNLQSNEFWLILPFIFQGMGLGCIFAPLGIQCIATLPKDLVHQANGIFNLMRVLGGSIGIAIIVTYFSRDGQRHWQYFGGFINPYNPQVNNYLSNIGLTYSNPLAEQLIANEILLQAQMQGIINSFYAMALIFLCTLPFVFLLDKRTATVEQIKDEEEELIIENF